MKGPAYEFLKDKMEAAERLQAALINVFDRYYVHDPDWEFDVGKRCGQWYREHLDKARLRWDDADAAHEALGRPFEPDASTTSEDQMTLPEPAPASPA